jgi:hypothetical protein
MVNAWNCGIDYYSYAIYKNIFELLNKKYEKLKYIRIVPTISYKQRNGVKQQYPFVNILTMEFYMKRR